jgi:type IV pilus assembly protein PilB
VYPQRREAGDDSMVAPRKHLGQILLDAGIVTQEQLDQALEQQKETGGYLGQVLIEMGVASKDDIGRCLEQQLNIPYINLSETTIEPEALMLVPERVARKHNVLPIRKRGDVLYVAMDDPLNLFAVDEIRLRSRMKIRPLLTTKRDLLHAINEAFEGASDDLKAFEDMQIEQVADVEPEDDMQIEDLQEMVKDSPIVKLVNSVISGAITKGASDVHFEPHEHAFRIRYRVDGALQDCMSMQPQLAPAIVSRVKVLAGMDIAERRRPQDGRVSFTAHGKPFDLRVSVVRTAFGEKAVIRVLDKSKALMGINALGMLPEQLEVFESLLASPHGMILVTGPTGSGKTTTLYSALNHLNDPTKNITTVEDPVEYRLPNINQIQVNPHAGVTFATGLRTILRQDPDIVMVGEIRDEETAEIAIHAALTGHLVLSTLHTNDAAGAVTRLHDMGIEPFLIASCLRGVLAVRLIRTICRSCRRPREDAADIVSAALKVPPGEQVPTTYVGDGCAECDYTGYRGRMGVFEVLRVTDKIRDAILAGASSDQLAQMAAEAGMLSLWESALERVRSGHTTIEQANLLQVEGT